MRLRLKDWIVLGWFVTGLADVAGAAEFQFAWFSDPHVGSLTGAEDLQAAVADVNSQPAIQFVIISGDVTEQDFNGNLNIAKSILSGLGCPYFIIPGNHDLKWTDSGGERFKKGFEKDRFDFEFQGVRFIGFHQGPLLKMGDGYIAREELNWLDSTLHNLPDQSQRLIVVTHYPMDNSVSNYFDFFRLIEGYNVQALLCGHGHANRISEAQGLPQIMSRSTLRAKSVAGGYTLVEVEGDSLYFRERPVNGTTGVPWAAIALQNRPYIFTNSVARQPDFSQNKNYPFVKVKWTFDTGATVTAAPASDGRIVVIGARDGNCYALSAKDGKQLWCFKTKAPLLGTAVIAGDRVVLTACDSSIYCLSAKTGAPLWRVKCNAPLSSTPAVESGTVYVGGADSIFRAINLKTGNIAWQTNGIIGLVETQPLLHDGRLIFGTWANRLYALQAKTGEIAWEWRDGSAQINLSPAACYPAAFQDKIYIVAPDRYMTCIRADSGKTLWRSKRYKVRESLGISEDGRTVFAKTMQDTVIALEAEADTPHYQWVVSAGYGYEIDPSRPVECGGKLFFGDKNGFVHALDAQTGVVLWHYRLGWGAVNDVVPLSTNVLLVSAVDGKLSLIEIKPNRK